LGYSAGAQYRIQSKSIISHKFYITDLNVRPEVAKLLEENRRGAS
jgi:hypothetical protein